MPDNSLHKSTKFPQAKSRFIMRFFCAWLNSDYNISMTSFLRVFNGALQKGIVNMDSEFGFTSPDVEI